MSLKRFAIACTFLLALPAHAQVCTFTNSGLNWGNIDLSTGTAYDLIGTFTASCTGTSGGRVRVCPNFNTGSGGANTNGSVRYMLNGANALSYNIYSNSARSTVWGSRTWGKPPVPPSLTVRLNAAGTGTGSLTLYGRVLSGQSTLPAGAYSSSFAGTQTQVAYAYTSVGSCSAIGLSHVTAVPFTAQANYGGTCTVRSATTMNFGSHGVLTSNMDAQNSIAVQCTTGAGYSIGLDGGRAVASDPTQRQMYDPTDTENVAYGIYRDSARTQPWGDTIGANTLSGVGNGTSQSYTAYGRVPPQPTPTAQTYTDTVVITVTY